MNYISASQIDTFEDCNRFWWFMRVLKLEEPPASHFTFGTVLHAVCERYLSATDNGRVPGPPGAVLSEGPLKGQQAGLPVNLYPPGWETATERDGSEATVTRPEARLIQRLVAEAIEEGILERSEGAQVERKILLPVIDGVQLIGYIDVYRPQDGVRPLPLIEDHKTYGKSSVRFLKREDENSPNYLGGVQQLKTYSWAVSELDEWAGDVDVQHNQFPKFPDKAVMRTKATITAEEIVEHGDYLRDVATRMQRTRKIKDWADVPGPKDTGKCARWYGKPCPFSDICGRAETPDAYRARLERLKAGSPAARLNLPLAKPKRRTRTKESNVTIFDRAKKQKAARAARKEAAGSKEAKAAVEAEAEAPAINGAAPEPVATVTGGAPWANPECKACKGRGLTSKHKACPICDNTAKRGGRPTSMAYVLEITDENTGLAVARQECVEELEAAGYPLEWDETEAAEAPQEPAEEPQAAEEAEAPAEPEAPEEPEEDPQEAKKAAAAKKKAEAARKRKEKAEAKKAAAAAKKAAEEEAAQAAEEPAAETPAAEAPEAAKSTKRAKGKAGRPTVGLTILVGCDYLQGAPGGRTVITSAEALARFGAELAEDMGAESYWALDSFKRRERLAQKADYIASSLAKHILIHPMNLSPHDDASALIMALMGLNEGIEAVITRMV